MLAPIMVYDTVLRIFIRSFSFYLWFQSSTEACDTYTYCVSLTATSDKRPTIIESNKYVRRTQYLKTLINKSINSIIEQYLYPLHFSVIKIDEALSSVS